MNDYLSIVDLFKYDDILGRLRWKIQASPKALVGKVAGFNDGSYGYRIIQYRGKRYKEHRLIWCVVNGYCPESDIDHIDRDKENNHIENLREVSRTCNLRNTGNFKNCNLVKGVLFHKGASKWMAQVCVANKTKYLGIYSNFDEAVCARLAAEQCLGWHGCDSSSPAYKYVQGILA